MCGQRHMVAVLFQEKIKPLLIPFAVDAAHPFPYLASGQLALALLTAGPGKAGDRAAADVAAAVIPAALHRRQGFCFAGGTGAQQSAFPAWRQTGDGDSGLPRDSQRGRNAAAGDG